MTPTDIDWKRPSAPGALIPLAPAYFHGTMRRFVDEELARALPAPAVALAWHEAVMVHAYSPGSVLLVRSPPNFKQEQELTTAVGRRLRMTDNAPPWWIHAAAFAGTMPPANGFAQILDSVWCWMYRADKGARTRSGSANRAGWHIAHVLRAKPSGDGPPDQWDDATARRRFIRNMSPLNQFLVPKGNGLHVGGLPGVIATIADLYTSRYVDAFKSFLVEAGGGPSEIEAPEWDCVVEMFRDKLANPIVHASNMLSRSVAGGPSKGFSATGTPATSLWQRILGPRQAQNPRSAMLAAAPDADNQLQQLVTSLTVESLVGIANALYNDCNPRKLETLAPNDAARRANIAWSYLNDARRNPRLGGRWGKCVAALRDGAPEGVAEIARLPLAEFVVTVLRVESQVYRKLA
jgi:hypothetical protein